MIKTDILLIGGGGHAKACIDVVESSGRFNIVGYTDQQERLDPRSGIPYLGDDSVLSKYIDKVSFLVCIGQTGNAALRTRIYNMLVEKRASLATVIASSAIVSRSATIAAGTIVMHGAVVQAGTSIGSNCIINDKALIEHDARIGDHCHISTGAIINGSVTVGDGTFVGSGAVIRNGLHIGSDAVIGMGSAVVRDIPGNETWMGNPAKRKND